MNDQTEQKAVEAEAADRILNLIRQDDSLPLVTAVNDGSGSKRVWYQLVRTYGAWAQHEGLTMAVTGNDAERVALQVVRAYEPYYRPAD